MITRIRCETVFDFRIGPLVINPRQVRFIIFAEIRRRVVLILRIALVVGLHVISRQIHIAHERESDTGDERLIADPVAAIVILSAAVRHFDGGIATFIEFCISQLNVQIAAAHFEERSLDNRSPKIEVRIIIFRHIVVETAETQSAFGNGHGEIGFKLPVAHTRWIVPQSFSLSLSTCVL